jgi:hypothetical protein
MNRLVVVTKRSTYYPHLLAVLALWALAMTLDYHDQAAAANERAARIDKEFTACLKGQWRAVTDQGVELGCMPVQTNEPKRKRT